MGGVFAMSSRDLSDARSVTQVVSAPKDGLLQAGIDYAQGIMKAGQEADIAKNLSSANLEVAALTDKYRIDNEGNPMGGLDSFKQDRQAIFDKYGDSVSPLMRRQWNASAQKISGDNDIQQQAWGYKQTKVNTVSSINDTMKNNYVGADADGQKFGQGKISDIDAFLNFNTSKESLTQFGSTHLGETTTHKMMEDYSDDYIKTFVSGAVQANPSKGLKLLDDERVKSAFKDPEKYEAFRSATENRARAVQRNLTQGGVLRGIGTDNAPLQDGSGGSMTYAQIQQAGFSDEAKSYYETLNGFKGSGKKGGYTNEDKAGFKLAIFDSVQKLSSEKEADAGSVRVVQDSIYKAMNKGAITQAQGMDYIAQIVQPLADKKAQQLKGFTNDAWYNSKHDGFRGINDFYDKVKLPEEGDDDTTLTKDQVRTAKASNANTRSNLYDYFYSALGARAQAAGTTVAQLNDMKDTVARDKIYADAQTAAQKAFLQNKHPQLRTMPDIPNFVFTPDKLIQGMTGPRDVKTDATAKGNFKLQVNKKTGAQRRVYNDGSIEEVK